MARKYYQGLFRCSNPGKYRGDASKITYRSSYELKFMTYLDSHPSVVSWSSESVVISYWSPVHRRWRRYYPDFKVKRRMVDGRIETLLVEIKPLAETREPTRTGKSRAVLYEQATWVTNTAKWDAARAYCLERGMTFRILTEVELGINGSYQQKQATKAGKVPGQTKAGSRRRSLRNRKKGQRGPQ